MYEKYFEKDNKDVIIVINLTRYQSMNEINGEIDKVNSAASKYSYKLMEIRNDDIGSNHFKCMLVYKKNIKEIQNKESVEFISKAIDAKFKATMDYLKKKEKNDLINNTKGSY